MDAKGHYPFSFWIIFGFSLNLINVSSWDIKPSRVLSFVASNYEKYLSFRFKLTHLKTMYNIIRSHPGCNRTAEPPVIVRFSTLLPKKELFFRRYLPKDSYGYWFHPWSFFQCRLSLSICFGRRFPLPPGSGNRSGEFRLWLSFTNSFTVLVSFGSSAGRIIWWSLFPS